MPMRKILCALLLCMLSTLTAWGVPFKISGQEVPYDVSSEPRTHLIARGHEHRALALSWDAAQQNVQVRRGQMGVPGYFAQDVIAQLQNPSDDDPLSLFLRWTPEEGAEAVTPSLEGAWCVTGSIKIVFPRVAFHGHSWRWREFAAILAPKESPSIIRKISFFNFPGGKLPNDNRMIPRGGVMRLGGPLDFGALIPFGDAESPFLVENCDVVLHVDHSRIPQEAETSGATET